MYTYHKQTLMGKGDKKTAKGKRAMGSYGKTRKRKEDAPIVVVKKEKKEKPAKAEPKAKATAAKKPAAKKTTTKKSEWFKELPSQLFFFATLQRISNH